MYKTFKTPIVDCLENGNYHVYGKLFHQKQHFFNPRDRKFQEPGNKQNKFKENY